MTHDAALRLIRAAERTTDTQQTSGMTREVAIARERGRSGIGRRLAAR